MHAFPQPFNPQPLISHLTNSNGCGNLSPKVLLTCPRIVPSFFPNPGCFPRTIDFYRPCFHILTNPFSHNSFIFTSIQNPRGVGISALYLATRHFPFVLSSLPPLGLSCLSFPRSRSLFSTICGLFCKNAGVCGWHPDPVFGLSAGVDEDSRCRRRNYGTPRRGVGKHCSGFFGRTKKHEVAVASRGRCL
jgi:hypothetical protein